jgi:prephenate dehydrogenase
MIIGIVGLGLIGGSLAKAYKNSPGFTVYGADLDHSILDFAQLCGAIDGPLTPDALGKCDCLLIAISPNAASAWLEENAPFINQSALVMDCCGTKRKICETGFRLAEEYGFEFVGGHPMAGTQFWGFKHSSADLFRGACMVVVPRTYEDIGLFERIKQAILPAGFGSISVTTAEKHDQLIAFTSQLAHVVSNAYIKSPTATEHKGLSATSYRDLTRVAWLNPEMWSDLFLENSDNLLTELDLLLNSLQKVRATLANGDRETLRELLEDGRSRKLAVDGNGK